jgi:hypothetical protein
MLGCIWSGIYLNSPSSCSSVEAIIPPQFFSLNASRHQNKSQEKSNSRIHLVQHTGHDPASQVLEALVQALDVVDVDVRDIGHQVRDVAS